MKNLVRRCKLMFLSSKSSVKIGEMSVLVSMRRIYMLIYGLVLTLYVFGRLNLI